MLRSKLSRFLPIFSMTAIAACELDVDVDVWPRELGPGGTPAGGSYAGGNGGSPTSGSAGDPAHAGSAHPHGGSAAGGIAGAPSAGGEGGSHVVGEAGNGGSETATEAGSGGLGEAGSVGSEAGGSGGDEGGKGGNSGAAGSGGSVSGSGGVAGSGGSPGKHSHTFDVLAKDLASLLPADGSTPLDPTNPANTPSGSTPYFEERSGVTLELLQALMADDQTFPVTEDPVIVQVGDDRYTGYRLADVVVRITKFRPADTNTGAFGATSAVTAVGANGYTAVFSFTELVRSNNGNKTIVAYLKNGAPLPESEGRMAVIAGNDTDPELRNVPGLTKLIVQNEYERTTYALPSKSTPPLSFPDVQFTLTGAVETPLTIHPSVRSTTSSQGYYAIEQFQNHEGMNLPLYYFQEYGPRHTGFWWGQGVRLRDVLDAAGLAFPNEKNRCYVVIKNANNQHALFSCGELYNSEVGSGDGLSGPENRSRSKGVILVTDDFRSGGGNGVMMTCWNDLSTCTKNDAGNPEAYTSNMDTNGDLFNDQSIALVSTEDKLPFVPFDRWYPMPANCATQPWRCNPWIDVGERLQQNIKSVTVHYAEAPSDLAEPPGNETHH